jgi:hypothetical protein
VELLRRGIEIIDWEKSFKKVKDLFGEDILIKKEEGEEEEETSNDVFIYKTILSPPKSTPPTKD